MALKALLAEVLDFQSVCLTRGIDPKSFLACYGPPSGCLVGESGHHCFDL